MAKKAVSKAPRSDASPESNDVGARAKSLRLHQRMTLDELAAHTGVSKGHLSRFERGQKSLSLAMLMRLADALHASVAELLGEPTAAGKSHLSKAAGRTFRKATATDGGYAFAALSRSNDPMINSFVVEFSAADTEMRKSATAHHSGEEIFFVLEGAVEIELGNRTQLLNEGDYLQFPGSVKHNVRSVRKRSKVLVIVVQR
ncbi:XRE family transcriptional regulator [Bradyrhizobium prioriisuperbiae]|uniref:helix-turn-helix domain-containing protein n=1 Tax=Bradyrhizobium prioriisuperbiae TaxID=2854389 RepID=UPI0028ECBC2D|nr:XRE family transcriptional regulator [Bradyrhizobium prioritasuperba]